MFLNLDGMGTRRAQLVRALKEAILDGRLKPQDRLPSSRVLAMDFGLSRNTVLAGYEQLCAEGFVSGRIGSGTYVAAIEGRVPAEPSRSRQVVLSRYARRGMRAQAKPMPGSEHKGLRYNLQYGVPLVNPVLTEAWRRELSGAAAHAPTGYPDAQGVARLRAAVCDYLKRRRGVQTVPGNVLIVSGTQQAFSLAAQVLLNPGDGVVLEEPHYVAASRIFKSHGAALRHVPVDDEGLVCGKLSRGKSPKLICVTPSHQFPLGAVMSLARRLALLGYAQANDAWVLEDDYDGEFRYGAAPLAALHSLDSGDRTLYVGTFSKALFPSLRLGYMVLPEPLVGPFRIAKSLADFGCSAIEQLALANFICNGGFERHLRRAAKVLHARRMAILEGLEEHASPYVDFSDSRAGMHLVAWLRDLGHARCEALIANASRDGLGLFSVAPHYFRPPRRAGLLIGYAGIGVREIPAAMRLLGEHLRRI